MKYFVWSVALYGSETWKLRRSEQKRLEAFQTRIWRRMEHVKWTDKIKYAVVLERVGERRIMLELIKKRKINWLNHWLKRNCLLKDAVEGMVNGKKIRSRRRHRIIDNIMINGLYEDMKRKAEKRVEWRMLSLQCKTCLRQNCSLGSCACSEGIALGQNTHDDDDDDDDGKKNKELARKKEMQVLTL